MDKLLKDKLKALKDRLYHGAITQISKETGFSRTHIYDVLNGYYLNERIIEAAKAKIKEKEEKENAKIQSYIQLIES